MTKTTHFDWSIRLGAVATLTAGLLLGGCGKPSDTTGGVAGTPAGKHPPTPFLLPCCLPKPALRLKTSSRNKPPKAA